MRLKAQCGECKALHGLGLDAVCWLGYAFVTRRESVSKRYPEIKGYVHHPTAPCPKPRTWRQFTEAKHCRDGARKE